MKVNFACGRQTWDGWFCVDAVQHPKATRDVDLLHAFSFDDGRLINPLPIDDWVASEVHAYHFIEHVYIWEAVSVLKEFHRIMAAGGRLVLELPNLEKACRNLLKGKSDQYTMWPLYGDPKTRDPHMCHRWGYTPETIQTLVLAGGFKNIQVGPPQTHGRRSDRDMRVEAIK